MSMVKTIVLPLVILGNAILAGCIPNFSNAEFRSSENALPECPGDFFTSGAQVFDAITICATSKVPTDKLRHAANVTAEWLDQNHDGAVDEPDLVVHLAANRAVLLMSESGFNSAAMDRLDADLQNRTGQDLGAFETNPGNDNRDASQEEIHHLIQEAGWKHFRPDIFDPNSQSALRQAWQEADAASLYVYDDPTCDNACKSVEFIYLSMAAYLGSSSDLASDEMHVKNRKDLRVQLPKVMQIIENPEFNYGNIRWPTGDYVPTDKITYLP